MVSHGRFFQLMQLWIIAILLCDVYNILDILL